MNFPERGQPQRVSAPAPEMSDPGSPAASRISRLLEDMPEVDLAFHLEAAAALPSASREGDVALRGAAGAESTWTALFRQWLAALTPELPPALRAAEYCLGLSLVDDAAIAELNSAWRHQEGPTDVLAFAAQENAPPLPGWGLRDSPPLPLELGDIVISIETASRQAIEAGLSLNQELLFLATHGLLHLLGWDHPDEPSLAVMLARQNDLLSITGHLPQGTDEP